MYSLVLMAALTTGSSTPDFGHHRLGCHGGCYGSSCCGGSCYGGGCYGGGCYGSASYGGCYGSSSYGCYGSSSYGGCYGSCWGGSCYGSWNSGYGCFGSASYSAYAGYSCHGCYGCGGCYGCYGGAFAVPTSPYGVMPSSPIREVVPFPKKDGSPESMAPTRAKLIVELPADATLYIDDQKMNATSGRRVFNTPALDLGETYYYMVRAEVMKDGKPVTATKRVIVKPGEEINADFRNLAEPTVTTVKLK